MNKVGERVVLTGAPGTGKTKVIEAIEAMGYRVHPEVIRTFTQKVLEQEDDINIGNNPLEISNNPLQFNQSLIDARVDQWHHAQHDVVSYYDRGIPDVLAYMNYFSQSIPDHFWEMAHANSYNKIFIFPPWKDIYTVDHQRLETFEQAVELDRALVSVYESLGYSLIEVPRDSIENRADFILNTK